jgi:hypothetical protein
MMMEINMKVISPMIKKKVLVFYIIKMVQNMKVILKKII